MFHITPSSYVVIETYGYGSVVRIPRGATNVRISDNSTSYLGMIITFCRNNCERERE